MPVLFSTGVYTSAGIAIDAHFIFAAVELGRDLLKS